MKSKIVMILICSIFLVACQTNTVVNPTPDVTLKFEIPGKINSPPGLKDTPETVDIKEGQIMAFDLKTASTEKGSRALLLVIEGKEVAGQNGTILKPETPFTSGKYVIKLTPGNNPNNIQTIRDDAEGTYKYILIDRSSNKNSNTRPPLDPKIRVGPGNAF